MKTKLNWLPSIRTCRCSNNSMNCLDEKFWFKNQFPIWRFSKKELRGDFERYSKKVHPAVFPKVLAKRIIEIYTHKGESVLDIFSGVGTTVVSAVEEGRNGIGLELNPIYVKLARRRLKYILESAKRKGGVLPKAFQFHADARDLLGLVPKNSIDLVLTSPPYWDLLKQPQSKRNRKNGKYLKKNYSDDRRDLSNLSTLDLFLKEMVSIFTRVRKVLKPDGRFVLITGDYRRRGQYIPLHSIYIQKLSDIGLDLNNVVFWDRFSEYDIDLYNYPHHFITANGTVEYILEFIKNRF